MEQTIMTIASYSIIGTLITIIIQYIKKNNYSSTQIKLATIILSLVAGLVYMIFSGNDNFGKYVQYALTILASASLIYDYITKAIFAKISQ